MSGLRKTAIVTGASQGIGAGIVNGFVERGFNVVANYRFEVPNTSAVSLQTVSLVPLFSRVSRELRRLNVQ